MVMADVRSMLRAERESRRITHPHASYTSTGGLSCNICEVPVKSERAWSAHLHTTQHSLRLARERDALQARKIEDVTLSKKRKAAEFEEPAEAERKKVKPTAQQSPDHDSVLEAEDAISRTKAEQHPVEDSRASEVQDDIDDAAVAAELEALQRDLSALEQEGEGNTLAALSASATIAAPAMSAQELAAQAREEQSKQRSRRDEEIENEREDAARALEDEFEEMDSLQQRVKRLRERREALRNQADADEATSAIPIEAEGIPDRTVSAVVDDQDSEDSDQDDDWAFGAR